MKRRRLKREQIWYYLSFANDDGFRGGCYVEVLPSVSIPDFAKGKGIDDQARALAQAHRLGISPGGEVLFMGPLPDKEMDAHVPVEKRNRLLSREELEA